MRSVSSVHGRARMPKVRANRRAIEFRIGRAARRDRILRGGDRRHARRAAGERRLRRHDAAREAVPRGHAGCRRNDRCPRRSRPRPAAARSRGSPRRDRASRSGSRAGRRPRAVRRARREPQHGFQKVVAELAVDPGRAQDHMARRRVAQRALARLLAAPVGAGGRDRIGLDIGASAWRRRTHSRSRCGSAERAPPLQASASTAGPVSLPCRAASVSALGEIDLGVGRRR